MTRLSPNLWMPASIYFDVAPAYGDGEAEIKLGRALAPYRSEVFLAGKTFARDSVAAGQELDHSLRRFHTECLDLYQFHAVIKVSEVERIFGPGGAGGGRKPGAGSRAR